MLRRRNPAAVPDAGPGDGEKLLALVLAALEAVPVGVVIEDATGRRVAANRRAETPFNDFAADALSGAAVQRAIARAREGDPASEVVDLHGPLPRRVEVSASPLSGGAVVAVVVDASERRYLDAVRRDFVANVNHELRTPIGALAVLAETLADERDPATVERLAGRIATEAERARALIEDLLDFSRVESDDQPAPTAVSLDTAVDAAVTRVLSMAEAKGVRIEVVHAPTAVVDGEADQLAMAIANLIDNAVKYSDSGTTVRVATSVGADSVSLSVADEGVGIPARDLDRIFERFYRVDSARDRRTGGTGLGLAIVRHVAANHGGSVSVVSQEGRGSTFTLTLPLSGDSA